MVRVNLGQFLLLTLVSWVPSAGGSRQQGHLDYTQHWTASSIVTSSVFVLLRHPESTCCSEPRWFQFPRFRSCMDVWPSSSCAVLTSPGDSQVSWFFWPGYLTVWTTAWLPRWVRVFNIYIFKALAVTGTIPISHHLIVAILNIFLTLILWMKGCIIVKQYQ